MENAAKKHKSKSTDDLHQYILRYEKRRLCPDHSGGISRCNIDKGGALKFISLQNIFGFDSFSIFIEDFVNQDKRNSMSFCGIKSEDLDAAVKVTEPGRFSSFQRMRLSGYVPLCIPPPELTLTDPKCDTPDLYVGRTASEYTRSVYENIKGPVTVTVTVSNPVLGTEEAEVNFQILEIV